MSEADAKNTSSCRFPIVQVVIGVVIVVVLVLHLVGLIPAVTPTRAPDPELGSKRFDRITITNLSATDDIPEATVELFRRQNPEQPWTTYVMHVPPAASRGRILNLDTTLEEEQIVRVRCSFTIGEGPEAKTYQCDVATAEAIESGIPEPEHLQLATFWFGPVVDPDPEPGATTEHDLCGQGLLSNHQVWCDYPDD